MKSSQALQIIGGIIGLGVVGVVTTLLLTRDENEQDSSQSGGEQTFGFRSPFGPISLPVTLTTADGSDTVQNNTVAVLSIDSSGPPSNPYPAEDVEFFFYAGTPSEFPLSTRRKPKRLKRHTTKVGKKKDTITVPINFQGVTDPERLLIRVTGIGEDSGVVYSDDLLVTLKR